MREIWPHHFVKCDEAERRHWLQSAAVPLHAAEEVPPMSASVSNLVVGRPQIRSALTALAELHQLTSPTSRHAAIRTGFDRLDEVLAGGMRPGEVVLLGGKPGVGKTIAALQWARSMAQRGVVAVYLCFEHDEVTLLTRLLSCELGEMITASPHRCGFDDEELPARIRDVAAGAISLREAVDSDPLIGEAQRRVAAYADRLVLVTGSGAHTNVDAIGEITQRFEAQPVALFVDYVQKVPHVLAVEHEDERVGRVIEGLKQLALDQKLVVVAIAAAAQDGLDARRVHLRHFRGSTALAYEADAVVVLNDKLAVVSRARVAHSPTRAEEFERYVVFSVEKNRNGFPNVELEFEKDFAHYRFHPHGRWVTERLWTEGSDV
jgi:replicative DNA helicase